MMSGMLLQNYSVQLGKVGSDWPGVDRCGCEVMDRYMGIHLIIFSTVVYV